MWIVEANAMIIMATIAQSHHCIHIEVDGVASHMFVSVAFAVAVTPPEAVYASTITPVCLSQ